MRFGDDTGSDPVGTMTAMSEVDPVEQLYRARATPELVEVPPLRFLCVDGHGDPNTSPAYAEAVQALYSVSYTAKFAIRKAGGDAFKVAPLEGLWWAEDPGAFLVGDKSSWDWTMMIRQPEVVTAALVERFVDEVAEKKDLPAARRLRLEIVAEGPAAQVLYVGPYAGEGPTIAGLHDFIHEHGFALAGKHHEIYLSDPRRTAPERLRTIIRQPYQAG